MDIYRCHLRRSRHAYHSHIINIHSQRRCYRGLIQVMLTAERIFRLFFIIDLMISSIAQFLGKRDKYG